MKHRSHLGFVVAVAAFVAAGGTVLFRQWNQTLFLRAELELARIEKNEQQRLQAENIRLRARQIPTAALESLRADHVALSRLRTEFEALNQRQSLSVP